MFLKFQALSCMLVLIICMIVLIICMIVLFELSFLLCNSTNSNFFCYRHDCKSHLYIKYIFSSWSGSLIYLVNNRRGSRSFPWESKEEGHCFLNRGEGVSWFFLVSLLSELCYSEEYTCITTTLLTWYSIIDTSN